MALQGFNKEYYLNAKLEALQTNPETSAEWQGRDIAALEAALSEDYGLTPEEHYLNFGYQENLTPNAYFDPDQYVQAKAQSLVDSGQYDNVTQAREAFEAAWQGDAYEHYLQYGASEGINPSNDFDASAYYEGKLAGLQADPATADEWANASVDDVKAAFDEAGLTPLGHFVEYGQEENLVAPEVPDEEAVSVGGDEEPSEPTSPPADEDNNSEEPSDPTPPPVDEGDDEEPSEPTPPDQSVFAITPAELDAESHSVYYDAVDVESYQVISLAGFDDRGQEVILDGIGDKKILVEDSSVTLNLNGMASSQIEFTGATSSNVLLYGDTELQENGDYTPTGMLSSLAIIASSNAQLELGESASAGLDNLTIAGDGTLSLSGNALPEGAVVSAQDMDGSLNVKDNVLDAAASVVAGNGNDRLTIDELGTVNEADYTSTPSVSINGGAGDDRLVVTDVMTVDKVTDSEGQDANSGKTVSANVTDVETVTFQGYVEVDAQDFEGTKNFIFASGGSISNVSDQTITATAGDVEGVGSPLILRDAGQTVNVASTFSAQNEVLDLNVYDDSADDSGVGGTLNLAGSGAIAYVEAGRQFDNINATELNGGLEFTGADYVQEDIQLGSGADTLNVEDASIFGSDGEQMDTITGFDATNDTLDIGALGDVKSISVAEGTAIDAAFASAATVSAENDNGYVAFELNGNTYVYADSETQSTDISGNVSDETGVSYNDFAVELMGLQEAIADPSNPAG
ncbi:hypothetical protein MHM84_11675 [Halomonas sp. McH1-25]|uniref:hypothetical protein n=1 Tax=unclassified Halomonas TaxID=2609666 RepID=UPI001EF49D7A|nr:MULTISPECIES: hypothetical protein [unclassified Halomonas]MCG7600450.1 hypothetical protein [Halomonas sp. McH1-25]MCP1342951.1 hypothetical protein [Halomonas sp. FL8]MCP1359957.1 hypothetical protein [Halomonas sp. BBD45]MCP1364346.1 hypothetical protein [Halomonas sp. BBD48]